MQYNRIIGGKSVCIFLGVLIFSSSGYPQQWDLRGQLSFSVNASNDPSAERSNIDQLIGYIPTLSVYPEQSLFEGIDFEAALNLNVQFDGFFGSGNKGTDGSSEFHRLWVRYSSESVEFRYGLQKIAFGPGLILRPLRWFDSLDPKDPTGQTDAVTSARFRYFGKHDVTYWGWAVHPENSELFSPGGRIELPVPVVGELGLTYHHRPGYEGDKIPDNSGMPFVHQSSQEDRYGIDIRADVVIGIWAEAVVAKSSGGNPFYRIDRSVYMIGGDYTLSVGNGLYLLAEHMFDRVESKFLRTQFNREFTAFMMNYPIGIFDQVALIFEYDWDGDRMFNFLKISRTYDNLTVNLILFDNPKRKKLNEVELSGAGNAGFGTGFQAVLVYNH